ncbi:APC family permease [Lacrimispora sp. 210928-DFI.3.58]|nr:APC family permease [Lacrimispora sp. 210928-DFI.3.58]
MEKKLTFTDCMSFCIGQIVGSGVFVLTGIVIGLTGHGAPYGFLVAALIALCQLVPMAILASSMPATGGSYVYAKRLIGPRVAFVFLMLFILQQVLISTFAIGFASYVAVIFPGVNQMVVALGALTAAVIVNMIGLKTTAKVQNCMVALLLISLFIYIVFGLPKVDWSALELTTANLMPNGPLKFFRGCAMLSFACAGAKFLAENGGEVENPGKTIPRAMVISTVVVAVFYALVGVVAACVLPVEEVAGTNISVVAKSVFPAPIYLFFVIGGAWFALLTTLNGTLSWTTRSLHRAAKDGWLPEFCAKENKNGVPVVLLLFFFVVGVIPIVTGMDTADISNMGTGCSKLADLLMVYACFRLPTMFPEEYKKSALYIAPKKLNAALAVVFVVLAATSYVSLSGLSAKQFMYCGIYIVAASILMMVRYKHFKDNK